MCFVKYGFGLGYRLRLRVADDAVRRKQLEVELNESIRVPRSEIETIARIEC